MQNFRTVLANLKGAVTGMPKNVRAYFDIAEKFAPDVVISDFESWSYLFGKNHMLPVLSVDNIQMITRCTHAPEILAGHENEFRIAKTVIKPKVAGAFHYLITTFFYPPVRKPRTTLVPPILRPQILAAERGQGDHLLVYQTSTSNTALPEILARSGRECRIYGLRRDLKEDVVEGNLRYRPFSEDGFIDDLRTARGVIASGGFTLMGEAVYLRRPMLAVPVGGQFEQVLNARYLEARGLRPGRGRADRRAAVGVPRTPARLRAQAGRLPPAAATSNCSRSWTTSCCRPRRHLATATPSKAPLARAGLITSGENRLTRKRRRRSKCFAFSACAARLRATCSPIARSGPADSLPRRRAAHRDVAQAGSFASAQPRHSIVKCVARLVAPVGRALDPDDPAIAAAAGSAQADRQHGGALRRSSAVARSCTSRRVCRARSSTVQSACRPGVSRSVSRTFSDAGRLQR